MGRPRVHWCVPRCLPSVSLQCNSWPLSGAQKHFWTSRFRSSTWGYNNMSHAPDLLWSSILRFGLSDFFPCMPAFFFYLNKIALLSMLWSIHLLPLLIHTGRVSKHFTVSSILGCPGGRQLRGWREFILLWEFTLCSCSAIAKWEWNVEILQAPPSRARQKSYNVHIATTRAIK